MSRKLGAEGRSSSRALEWRGGRARRRRRRRERRAPDRAASPPARAARDRLRPPGDDAGRGGARRPNRVRRRQLLRARSARRCRTCSRRSSTTGTTGARRRSCARSALLRRTTGALLVIDAVVPPGNEPHGAKLLDLLDARPLRRPRARRGPVARAPRGEPGSSRSASRTAWSRRDAADRRHRRPHRPRQDVARAGLDREGHRPAARGAGARDLDRPRLRPARAARRAPALARSTFPGTSASSATWSRARPGSTSSCS